MPRLTITLPTSVHSRVSSIATEQGGSMSNIINQLVGIGLNQLTCLAKESDTHCSPVEEHCYQLVMQMNAIIKQISIEVLKLDQDDLDVLRQSAEVK